MNVIVVFVLLAVMQCVNSQQRSFNLALWHEGVVGQAATDLSVYKSYVSDMITFATKHNINQIFLNVLNPTYSPYSNASFIAENFLDALPSSSDMTAGVVSYCRAKDSDWTVNTALPGNFNTCTIVPPSPSPDHQPCPSTAPFPEGCPNDMAQVMWYVNEINQLSKVNKFITIAFDGEDLGAYAEDWGMCQMQKTSAMFSSDLKYYGYAKGPAITPQSTKGNVAYPEMYWVGELSATGCHGQQTSPQCTNTTYKQYKNQPQAFLDFWAPQLDAYKSSVSQEGVWVMFSIENLSYGLLGANYGPLCIAAHYFGSDSGYKPSICGTFDGFSFWDWPYFEEFLQLYSDKYNAKSIVVYEAQFIPQSWLS